MGQLLYLGALSTKQRAVACMGRSAIFVVTRSGGSTGGGLVCCSLVCLLRTARAEGLPGVSVVIFFVIS